VTPHEARVKNRCPVADCVGMAGHDGTHWTTIHYRDGTIRVAWIYPPAKLVTR
jgi:hypothetical protein